MTIGGSSSLMLCIVGTRYVSVLPEPVCAPRMRLSRPRMAGIAKFCSSFGLCTPAASSAAHSSSRTPSAANAEGVAAVADTQRMGARGAHPGTKSPGASAIEQVRCTAWPDAASSMSAMDVRRRSMDIINGRIGRELTPQTPEIGFRSSSSPSQV